MRTTWPLAALLTLLALAAARPCQAQQWKPLLDGRTLAGWKSTPFGGEGQVRVEDGAIIMEMGADLTGVNYTQAFPKSNYEIALEARRIAGDDFFCGLTFPVKDSACSLILGGWGGSTVGLSSLDGFDAAENETTTFRTFERNRWYAVRVRVTDDRITAWIDDEQAVDVDLTGRHVDVRLEVELSKPLGIATWVTTGAARNIRYREIK